MPLPFLAAAGIASVAAPIVGGIVGHFASAADRRRAQSAMDRAFQELEKIPDVGPDITKHIIFRSLKDAGLYTPELEKVIEVESPRIAELTANPEYLKKERAGLAVLKQMSERGLDAIGEANYQQARMRELEEQKKSLASIQQAEQAAGRTGGAGLAGKITSASLGAARIGEQAQAAAGSREEARRAALGSYLTGLTGSEERRVGLEQTRLSALDKFAQAQGVRRQDVQQRNVAAGREAQLANIRTGQADIQQRLAQDAQRAAAERQKYEDLVAAGTRRANIAAGQAAQYQQQAGQTAGLWGGIGTGIGRAAGAYATYGAKPELFTNKSPFPMDETGYDYGSGQEGAGGAAGVKGAYRWTVG